MTLMWPSVPSLDVASMEKVARRQEQLAKPVGSLGRLETLAIQLAGIYATTQPRIEDKAIVIMAGDHGVVAEGVSAFPAEVTAQMVVNFLRGGAAINVLARQVGARVIVVDMGVAADLRTYSQLIHCKVGWGTGNIAAGPAMSYAQAEQAVQIGLTLIASEIAAGLDLVGVGEMGIGNTTAAAAVAAALTGIAPEEIVGVGTGLDAAGRQRKVAIVEQALKVNRPDPHNGLEVLAKVGGFEIGGLAGVMIGAAAQRKAVVVDGFISTAAAMIAVSLVPAVRDFLIGAHLSAERGHGGMLKWLGVLPLLALDLRLGEGTGAALAFPLLEASLMLIRDMATFADAGVSGRR